MALVAYSDESDISEEEDVVPEKFAAPPLKKIEKTEQFSFLKPKQPAIAVSAGIYSGVDGEDIHQGRV